MVKAMVESSVKDAADIEAEAGVTMAVVEATVIAVEEVTEVMVVTTKT